ncbi:hypothetical protein DCAR_0518892 [Daucus carota subsp. sativus]|uniref:Uncharacterized protein n=1 Tax=Daucus carota subsp. sativus TaxID=79200 RepID=A0AAF1AYL8_DAUCS|nr:PREDICTED: protein NRT1/ PTR FAMILY 2.11-like [Daucus carota subsp. sativus]WOG99539.1 hypothetical protein DCAR_0518892 [Daucus carota subsp. sativus]
MDKEEMETINTSYEKIVPIKDQENDEPQVNYRGIKAMPYIIGNETFEKLGSMGLLVNLVMYLSSVFNMKNIQATTLMSAFQGTTNLATIVGAFLSDTYFGRYKTIAFASIASFMGLAAINLTAAVSWLHPPPCGSEEVCTGPTSFQMAFLLCGFGLMVIGAGGIRPCNMAFGADQFNPNTESGKRGVNSFVNWYFITLTFAQMVSVTIVVYIQTVIGWSIGLAIPTFFMFVSCLLFFFGSKIYVKVKAEGSPMTSVVRVLVVAFKKRHLPPQPSHCLYNYAPPKSISSKLPHTRQFRFLDKAAIATQEDKINADGTPSKPWNLCSLQQVEAVKCLIRVLPIWACGIIYTAATAQQHQFIVFQALQSDRRVGHSGFMIPPASYVVFVMLSCTIFLTIYDRIIVPQLRKITGKDAGITILQRIGCGIFLTIAVSLLSAYVEIKRKHLALTEPTVGIAPHHGPISSMSGLWLVPQLTLNGIAEAFTSVALVEFYYKEFPENMKSIGGSFYCCGMAAGSYFYGFLIGTVHMTTKQTAGGDWLAEDLNKGSLEYFYYLLAALSVLNAAVFLVTSSWYKYKGTPDDETLSVELEPKQME